MSILGRITSKLRQKTTTEIPANDPPAGSNIATLEPETNQQGDIRIPISEGEYLPWKGLVFKIAKVDGLSFIAVCVGVTKTRVENNGGTKWKR